MKAAVVTYPGSNCADDAREALELITSDSVCLLHHNSSEVPSYVDLVVIPGGYSFGDYLRCGAIASRAPVTNAVVKFYERGGYILGICNGFQILTECRILPGALERNAKLKFICTSVPLLVCNDDSAFTSALTSNVITMPVAHHDGRYSIDDENLHVLNSEGRIAFRYATPEGIVSDDANINGSVGNIAGILSSNKRVLGMMPHPERAIGTVRAADYDGAFLLNGIVRACSTILN